ncbi:MAG: hypothetical protein MMC23_004545 [Stictis urceolatum]|nr:hypothetical protein [Stictis urceolata]
MSVYKSTVLITGGTTGLGFEAALAIARRKPDWQVVVASRSNTDNASDQLNARIGRSNVIFMSLDLMTTNTVRDFASRYLEKKFPPITALLLNAGIQFPHEMILTKEDIEATFAVNHLGHALLYHLLQSQLADDARIIVTSSGTHDPAQTTGLPDADFTTAEEIAHPTPMMKKNWHGRQRYGTSKLCNMLWTYALDRRLRESNSNDGRSITVNAFDPGLMPGTGLARSAGPVLRFVWMHVLPHLIPILQRLVHHNIRTQAESGAALARLAIDEDVQGITGKYYEGREVIESSVASHDQEKQEDLWSWTIKMVSSS